MTARRAAPFVAALALGAALALPWLTSLRSGPPAPVVSPSPSPSPTALPTPPPEQEIVQEIARDTVTGPQGSERDTAVEPYVSVDPNRPEVAVAAYQQGRFPDGGAAAVGFATSGDAGRSWTSGTLPGLTVASGGAFARASDPSVAFGPDGTVYIATIVLHGPDGQDGIAVSRSDDGGRRWNPPVLLERDPRGVDDFPRVAVDTSPIGEHSGRVYVTYARRERTVLRWSDDRADTWSALMTVSPGIGFVPNVVVGPDGALTVVYQVRRSGEWPRLASRTSRNGGRSFGPQVSIGQMRYHDSLGLRATGVEATAVDEISGALFVVWADGTRRGDGVNDVVMSRSLDRGARWTRPAKVNPDAEGSGTDHVLPTVAARDEQVRVVYMTRPVSNRQPSPMLQLRSISSMNGGASFEGERAIGPPADIRYAARVRPGPVRFVGDYIGVALTADSFLVVWSRSFPPTGVAGFNVTVWAAWIPEVT